MVIPNLGNFGLVPLVENIHNVFQPYTKSNSEGELLTLIMFDKRLSWAAKSCAALVRAAHM